MWMEISLCHYVLFACIKSYVILIYLCMDLRRLLLHISYYDLYALNLKNEFVNNAVMVGMKGN